MKRALAVRSVCTERAVPPLIVNLTSAVAARALRCCCCWICSARSWGRNRLPATEGDWSSPFTINSLSSSVSDESLPISHTVRRGHAQQSELGQSSECSQMSLPLRLFRASLPSVMSVRVALLSTLSPSVSSASICPPTLLTPLSATNFSTPSPTAAPSTSISTQTTPTQPHSTHGSTEEDQQGDAGPPVWRRSPDIWRANHEPLG